MDFPTLLIEFPQRVMCQLDIFPFEFRTVEHCLVFRFISWISQLSWSSSRKELRGKRVLDLYGLLISSIVFTLSAFLCEASKATRGALPAYIACLATIICCWLGSRFCEYSDHFDKTIFGNITSIVESTGTSDRQVSVQGTPKAWSHDYHRESCQWPGLQS